MKWGIRNMPCTTCPELVFPRPPPRPPPSPEGHCMGVRGGDHLPPLKDDVRDLETDRTFVAAQWDGGVLYWGPVGQTGRDGPDRAMVGWVWERGGGAVLPRTPRAPIRNDGRVVVPRKAEGSNLTSILHSLSQTVYYEWLDLPGPPVGPWRRPFSDWTSLRALQC